MIEILNNGVLWWHWIILGIILLIIEMNIGTFFILGLAVSAIIVGFIDNIIEISFSMEITLWMVLSILSISAWFKWLREVPKTKSGQSNYRLDTLGIVIENIEPHSRGKVKFDTPVLGNTVWHATAKENVLQDSRIRIVEINGQLIEVEPIK